MTDRSVQSQFCDSLPEKCGLHILCGYKNRTPKIQIIRITNIPNWYFERVIFPGELLLFEALPEAVLEIYSRNENSSILSDRLLCDYLRVEHRKISPIK